jgi:hypothetical protein
MKKEQDYIQDIAEIRSMMERSSKFLSLSGWTGILAGIYALAGAYIAWKVFDFNSGEILYNPGIRTSELTYVILLAAIVLLLALGTAIYESYRKAKIKGEKAWNPTSRRLLINMAVPLVTGGILVLIMLIKGLIGMLAPLMLLFYGLALYNAGKFTYREVKILGLAEIVLGLISSLFLGYGLIFWAGGFGVAHIVYGIYMHYTYER